MGTAASPDWDQLRLLSVTEDGALFIGTVAGEAASVLRLSASGARAVRERRRWAARLSRTARVIALDLSSEPAWIAVEQPYGTLASHPPHDAEGALAAVIGAAQALAEAHAAGGAHGAVSPGSVVLDASGEASLCFHGVCVEGRAPLDARAADDLFGLGRVVRSVLGAIEDPDTRAALAAWGDRLCDPDPAARPSAAAVVEALSGAAPADRAFERGAAIAPGVLEAHDGVEKLILTEGPAARVAAARLAWVRHPSLPEVIDGGGSVLAVRHPGGHAWSGSSLRVAAQVASALDAAHQAGVAHGALSRELVRVDGDRTALVGFGLRDDATPESDLAALRAMIPEARDLEHHTTASALAAALFERAGLAIGSLDEHPRAPAAAGSVLTHRFEWSLRAAPAALWPWVSNTERINRALGLTAVEQSVIEGEGGVAIHGRSSQAGFDLAWEERPHEWLAGRRLGVVREYSQGPLAWLRSTVELVPEGSGTRLIHTLESLPRNMLARGVAALEIGVRMKRGLEKVYLRIDALLAGELVGRGLLPPDAFQDATPLSNGREKALAALESRVIAAGASAEAVQALGDMIRFGPSAELARMQPLVLGPRFGIHDEAMITACFLAVAEGMLAAGWDLLCPSCRAPSGYAETLAALRDHGACEVCRVDYALDLSSCIELVFSPHPSLREVEGGTYCLSSPAHAPHVVAQVTVSPGERLELPLALAEGSWRVTRGAAAPVAELQIEASETLPWRAELDLTAATAAVRLAAGAQALVLVNEGALPLRVRVEAAEPRQDALTAARAIAHPLFARVFPDAALAAGVSLPASSMAFVSGSEGSRAFDDPARAFLFAVALAERTGRASVEAGPAEAGADLGFHGRAVAMAEAGLDACRSGEVVVGPVAASDPSVVVLARELEAEGRIALAGAAGALGTRFRIA